MCITVAAVRLLNEGIAIGAALADTRHQLQRRLVGRRPSVQILGALVHPGELRADPFLRGLAVALHADARAATGDEWVDVLRPAVARRFGRYEGNQLYHFGISVEGFMLAPPGVPLIYSPKSALIINVTVWDDAANAKLNPEVKQFTILESTTGGSFLVGSGHQRSKEEQMQGLAENAVREIEEWMVEMKAEQGWFEPRAGAATSATVPRDELVPQSEGVVPPTVPAVQG